MNTKFIQDSVKYFKEHKGITIGFSAALIVVVLCLSVVIAFNHFIKTPRLKNASEQRFVVVNGQGLRVIAENLSEEEIISNKYIFMIYLKLSGLSGNIQAGEYDLSPSMAPITIADILSRGKVTSRRITIPEGWTNDEIGTYLEKEKIVSKVDFQNALTKNYDFEFLSGRPEGATLEGFLFPDTYQVSVTSSAESIVKMMLENFDQRMTDDIKVVAGKSKFGLYGVVTLASIVEKEANKPEDRKVVAGIFLSRLEEGMRLQSDVTVAYGIGSPRKEDLTQDDLDKPTPYNTYIVDGLPKGPICNPGLDSIKAVLYPSFTDFRYFIASDEQMYYAKTIEEHNALVDKYLRR